MKTATWIVAILLVTGLLGWGLLSCCKADGVLLILSGSAPEADTDAPTPNPATFAVGSFPAAISSTSIGMTATTGTDATGPVSYYFTCTSGAGHDSGWQEGDATYTDTGLEDANEYGYTITMKDSLGNVGTASSEASATTASETGYYVGPYATGDESGDDADNLMAWASVEGSTSVGDIIYLRDMNDVITTTDWPDRIYYTNDVNEFDIEWTFDQDYRVGQFCNWDMWVIGPVTITAIVPTAFLDQSGGESKYRHGSTINPTPANGKNQGFGSLSKTSYVHSMNDAWEVNDANALVVPNSSSVVSTKTWTYANPNPTPNNYTYLASAAVLTVLSSPAATGSFRPAYVGTDKTIMHNESELNYNILGSVAIDPMPTPTSLYGLTTVTENLRRFWLDYIPGQTVTDIRPWDNMHNAYYGQILSNVTSFSGVHLNLNYTNSQKRLLYIRLVQYGLDCAACVAIEPRMYPPEGGHMIGEKYPTLLAGMALGDDDINAISLVSGDYYLSGVDEYGYPNPYGPGNPQPDCIYFSEDFQTMYIPQLLIDICDGNERYTGPAWAPIKVAPSPEYAYVDANLGHPEWVERWGTQPQQSANVWDGAYTYRFICSNPGVVTALAAHMTGMKTLWNHDAFFDYMDYYYVLRGSHVGSWYAPWVDQLWAEHRTDYGPVWSE